MIITNNFNELDPKPKVGMRAILTWTGSNIAGTRPRRVHGGGLSVIKTMDKDSWNYELSIC